MSLPFQHTLAHNVSCRGIGLHTGETVSMSLYPAAEDSGITFIRTDVSMPAQRSVPALYSNVSNTRLGTTISNEHHVSVATIEHLMAAFWGCNIDNAVVEISGGEVPIMDGSAEPFVFLLECAGNKRQSKPRRVFEVLKKVEILEQGKRASFVPSEHFSVSLEIDFDDDVISNQSCIFDSSDVSFKTDLCRARSFCFEHEVDAMRANGLGRGGSLQNAVVVSDKGVLNKEGLRYNDEFVRHKILDCIGDVYLGGGLILGKFSGYRSGHDLNNKLLRKLFSEKGVVREVEPAIWANSAGFDAQSYAPVAA